MTRSSRLLGILLLCSLTAPLPAATVQVLEKKHDPYGAPRPGAGHEHVPLETSFYLRLAVIDDDAAGKPAPGKPADSDAVDPDSVTIHLQAEGASPIPVLELGRRFAPGYSGRVFPGNDRRAGPILIIYADSDHPLIPSTRYTIRVAARSANGREMSPKGATWHFTTEAPPATHHLAYELRSDHPPVRWHGGFFTGFCKPSFSTSHSNRIPSYEAMDQVRTSAPKAWSLQRDFWMTGMEHRWSLLSPKLPNLVRELQTRRITAIEPQEPGALLRVEDFFGHRQYGIPADRPVSHDYHPGDEVLIADGVHDARAEVVSVDDDASTVLVTAFDPPQGGWKLEYERPLPEKEDPNAPGRFAFGGCYLRKFRPGGTPVYYWDRLDREWDLAHRRFRRRLAPNFADAPGDLSIDGRNWTTAKDFAEYHQVVRDVTGHLIGRYGDACLEFPWSVFNEPDLIGFFWRSDWDELQKFYDYTVDGVLRAFEDHGYDSHQVMVGGLELGGIFGVHLRLREFLAHCSPGAEAKGALELNAAMADPRLDGKRSKRVEELCRAHDGRGSPCDFISVHAYNASKLMAAKLARAKEMALEIDADYYDGLWVNSFESCPDWTVPPDPAYADSYLGNGYFPTWCADVARRQLQQAERDPRYAYGETILTFWPWPNTNFTGGNASTRVLHVDDGGDGRRDRNVTVAMPILHFLALLNAMGDTYRVLPEQAVGGHVVSGFASQVDDRLRVLLYSHHPLDTQSRSQVDFEVTLCLSDLPPGKLRVREHRFDKDHNSYFHLGRSLRDAPPSDTFPSAPVPADEVEAAIRAVDTGDRQARIAALKKLADLGPAAQAAQPLIAALLQSTDDEPLRSQALTTLLKINAPTAYPDDVVRKVEAMSNLHQTGSFELRAGDDGRLTIQVRLAANGANHLILEPILPRSQRNDP